MGEVSAEQLWTRLEEFLHEVVPVAEEAGVRLAAHPDDPPLPSLRGTARLVHKPEFYQRLLDIHPSPSNALEFCQGTLAEMVGEMDVYEAIDTYSRAETSPTCTFATCGAKFGVSKSSSTRGMSTWSAPSASTIATATTG